MHSLTGANSDSSQNLKPYDWQIKFVFYSLIRQHCKEYTIFFSKPEDKLETAFQILTEVKTGFLESGPTVHCTV